MPAPIVAAINHEIKTLQSTRAYAELLDRAAMEPTESLTPAQMTEFVRSEYQRWGPAIKASGATID